MTFLESKVETINVMNDALAVLLTECDYGIQQNPEYWSNDGDGGKAILQIEEWINHRYGNCAVCGDQLSLENLIVERDKTDKAQARLYCWGCITELREEKP